MSEAQLDADIQSICAELDAEAKMHGHEEHIASRMIRDLRKENARLRPWAALGEWVMAAWPELGDLDGFTLQELAVKAGVLVEIPGGYDSDHHIDSLGVAPERGDPWFEIIASPATLAERKKSDE